VVEPVLAVPDGDAVTGTARDSAKSRSSRVRPVGRRRSPRRSDPETASETSIPPPQRKSNADALDFSLIREIATTVGAVLRIVISHLAITVAKLGARAMRALRNACRPSTVTGGLIADLTRSRGELLAENAFLRQQLIFASRSVKRPGFRTLHQRFPTKGPRVLVERGFDKGALGVVEHPCWLLIRPAQDR